MEQKKENNTKRKMSITVSQHIYSILKQYANMSSYIESLVIKENTNQSNTYYEVKIWTITLLIV